VVVEVVEEGPAVVVVEPVVLAVVVVDGDVEVVVGAAGAKPAISTATRLVVETAPWRATRAKMTERGLGVALAAMTTRAEKASLEQALQPPEYPTEKGWVDTTSSRHDEAPLRAPETSMSPPKRLREAGADCTHRMAGRGCVATGPARRPSKPGREGWAAAVAATDRRAATA
jgi:hypothetical protein